MSEITFKQAIEANGGEPVEFKVSVPSKGVRELDGECHEYVTEGGGYLRASCWTDDEDVLAWPATFDVDASWMTDGGLGRYDNLHGELDAQIGELVRAVQAKLGGDWCFSESDCAIVQRRD